MPFKWLNTSGPPDRPIAKDMDNVSSKGRKSRRQSLSLLLKGLKPRKNREKDARHGVNGTNQDTASIPQPVASDLSPTKEAPAITTPSDDTMKRSDEKRPTSKTDIVATPEPEPQAVSHELNDTDIHTLFASAPQYTITLDGNAPEVSVGFPWQFDLTMRDTSDSRSIRHPAFSVSTLRTHLAAPSQHHDHQGHVSSFCISAKELPNMLRADGNEAGAVGFEFFTQLGNADFLYEGEDDAHEEEAQRNWRRFQQSPGKLGIRLFDRMIVYERLAELGEMYASCRHSNKKMSILDKQSPSELYALLYAQLLQPPRFDPDAQDPTGLKVQVESLSKILAIKGIWYDFSLVENRIRLGQFFWTVEEEQEEEQFDNSLPERDVLVLQITLAAELLVRLEAIAAASAEYVRKNLHLTKENVDRFKELQSRKLSWDLVLARRFLENIKVVCTQVPVSTPPTPKKSFFSSGNNQEDASENMETILCLLPRNLDQQLSGLLAFAQSIGWPDIDELESELNKKYRRPFKEMQKHSADQLMTPSIYKTPICSPSNKPSSQQTDYFNRPTSRRNSSSPGRRPSRPRTQKSRTHLTAQLSPSRPSTPDPYVTPGTAGASTVMSSIRSTANPLDTFTTPPSWVTPTYLTGLLLPGPTTSYFLLATLLENSPSALARVGESANLTAGFIYGGRSWWSTECVLGRVLAGLPGAKSCMGWVGTPVAPMDNHEGWIDVGGGAVGWRRDWVVIANEKGSDHTLNAYAGVRGLLGDRYEESNGKIQASADNFIIPSEPRHVKRAGLWFEGLKLVPSPTSTNPSSSSQGSPRSQASDPGSQCSGGTVSKELIPHLLFSSTSLSDDYGTQSVALRYDVYFISAWPCRPPRVVTVIKRAAADSAVADSAADKESHVEDLPSHPLHMSHRYTVVPAASVLGKSFALPRNEEEWEEKGVLVLDSRADATLELVARAWCAREGFDAVIGRGVGQDGGKDRGVDGTCLACCVREARIAGVRVVIRVSG
ncbi:hypothetical protein P152DRAFT_476969 [Eremomyces bilateralis CBS 781.70]|uniref:Uncharacterized protein n=1 Tax=Eremomyces bilateralis CBS 781.70 TaxID=1392243 RepID=A0A6G1FSY5_9PEZI|nr:uncharacterized protein P152DRAFT_476969 [Eremomyces bilateralis CBS 781.70]KAF1808873.1 hypothetical protein P152DRAFT_476969 [Eremomyces bilateralis CBS 781.70]